MRLIVDKMHPSRTLVDGGIESRAVFYSIRVGSLLRVATFVYKIYHTILFALIIRAACRCSTFVAGF